MKFGEWTRMKRWHCCWEKGRCQCNRVMEDVGECIYCIGWVDSDSERHNCCMGRLLLDIGPPLSCHLSPSLNSWTQYSF